MVSSSPPHQHPPHQHHHPVRPLAQYALVLSGGVSRRGKLEGQFAVSNTSWSGEPVALDVSTCATVASKDICSNQTVAYTISISSFTHGRYRRRVGFVGSIIPSSLISRATDFTKLRSKRSCGGIENATILPWPGCTSTTAFVMAGRRFCRKSTRWVVPCRLFASMSTDTTIRIRWWS